MKIASLLIYACMSLAAIAVCDNVTRSNATVANHGNVTSLECIEIFSTALDSLNSNGSRGPIGIERLVRNNLVPCLETAQTSGSLDVRMIAIAIINFPHQFFRKLAADFNKLTSLPYNIGFDFLPQQSWGQLVDEIMLEYKRNLSSAAHTGFLYGGLQLSAFAYGGTMADLSALVTDEGSDLGWLDILPFVRQQMATYGGKLVGIPLDGRANMIFYRMDILHKYNLSVPATYDDLLSTVAMLNGTRNGPNGEPMWGLCVPYLGGNQSCLLSHNFFWDVLSPYTQTRGPAQGMAVDPSNLQILFDNAAGAAAVTMMQRLLRFTFPSYNCGDVAKEFVEGKCAITFGRAAQFKMNQMGNKTVVRGKVRAFPCPGSTKVLDRSTGSLVDCTPIVCPFGAKTQLMDGRTALVNNAPFSSASGYAAAVSQIVPTAQRLATFRYLSYVAASKDLQEIILDPDTWWGPCRTSHFNVSAWEEKGYPRNITAQFLRTTRQLLGGHPNIALPPNFVLFTNVLVPAMNLQLLDLIRGRISGTDMQHSLVELWRDSMRQWGKDVALRQLRAALNWVPPRETSPPGLDGKEVLESSREGEPWKYITATSLVGVFLMAGFVVLVIFYYRGRGRGMSLFGGVLAPHEGPGSTLLVTDMQDSTQLWESLPMDVMDMVLKVHHSCLRSLLPAYRGYESMTEGDSLILAFHDAQSALNYALEAQKALLDAAWPLELLESPLCRPVYMRLVDRDPLDMQLDSDTSSADDGSSATGGLGACIVVDRFRPRPEVDGEGQESAKFSDVCRMAWEQVDMGEPRAEAGAILAFRGARVRMGLHSGVEPGETKVNSVDDRRTHYAGACLAVAKLVADCGSGGIVSISGSTYKQLSMEKLWKNMKLWHAGLHLLDEALPAMHIYQVLPPELSCRISSLPPVRSLQPLSPGSLDAPAGSAAVCFMKVAGLDTLKRWNLQVTNEAVALWQQVVLQLLTRHEGHALEVKDDVVLVAFGKAVTALQWATQCSRALLDADWSEELLTHEMGESVSVLLESEREGEWRSEVMMRGLRVKVGMDFGPVLCSVQPMTGKMAFSGRIMNRAARIAARAAPGQVLTTSYSWAEAGRVASLLAAPVGPVKLKGIADNLYLVQVKICRSMDLINSATSHLLFPLDKASPAPNTPPDCSVTIPSATMLCPAPSMPDGHELRPSTSDDISDQFTGEF